MHIDGSARLVNYNMGQIYLNNAAAWTFIGWDEQDVAYEPFNRHNPDSILVPAFINKFAQPQGIVNLLNLLNGTTDKKYGKLVALMLEQAYGSNDGFGCCGKVLEFLCNELDRMKPTWIANSPAGKDIGAWWKIYNKSPVPGPPAAAFIPMNMVRPTFNEYAS